MGGHSLGTPVGAPLPAGPDTLCPRQVRADHRHRPQLPVHHVISAEPLPALVLPGRWGNTAVPTLAGTAGRAEWLAPPWGRASSSGWAPQAGWSPHDLVLGSREGMGSSCELSRTQPLHPAPAPCPSTQLPTPAPSSLPCHPAPAMPSPWCHGGRPPWNPPLSPAPLPLHFLFQVQDFGLKHLLSMGSLRLLSLAGETPHLAPLG